MKPKLTLKKPAKPSSNNNDNGKQDTNKTTTHSTGHKKQSTLSLKKSTPPTAQQAADNGSTERPLRRKKKVIRREDIKADKLTRTKPQVVSPKPQKPPKTKAPQPITKPVKSPSDLRMEELDASLNAFTTWLNYRPLALGIEKQVFQHIAKHNFSSSKRVVKRLLRKHTRHPRYLQAVNEGKARFNLDGSEEGTIQQYEREYAEKVLAGQNAAKQP